MNKDTTNIPPKGGTKEHKVRRKDDSTRHRKASGVVRPRINSTTEEEIAEVGKPQDIKELDTKTNGSDVNIFKKVKIPNNLMNKITTTKSTKKEADQRGDHKDVKDFVEDGRTDDEDGEKKRIQTPSCKERKFNKAKEILVSGEATYQLKFGED